MAANPVWPAVLQHTPNQNFTEGIEDGVIHSKPEAGPSMSRPRFTRIRSTPKLSLWVDLAQYNTFMEFYRLDLSQGCLPFYWLHPIKQTPVLLKFMRPPSITYVGPMNWEISCEFEEV